MVHRPASASMLTAVLHRSPARADDHAFAKAHRRALRALESLDLTEDLEILALSRPTLLETLAHALHTADPRSDWLLVLGGGSFPLSTDLHTRLLKQPSDVAAVEGMTWVKPRGIAPPRRDPGTLPEAVSLRATAVRRSALLQALPTLNATLTTRQETKGLPSTGLVLSAALLSAGHRIACDPGLTFQRPRRRRPAPLPQPLPDDLFQRFRTVPLLADLPAHLRDRLSGVAAARRALARAYERQPFTSIAAIEAGPGVSAVRLALQELAITHPVRLHGETGMPSAAPDAACDAHLIATLATGRMLNAYERLTRRKARCGPRILCPFDFSLTPAAALAGPGSLPTSQPAA